MNEVQQAKTEVKSVSDLEFMQMAGRASDEIKMLRNVIARLEPKAHAYDKLSAVIDMMQPRINGISTGDFAQILDNRLAELQWLAKDKSP